MTGVQTCALPIYDRGCEAELATILDAGLAVDQLPDMAVLRERFAPDPAALPGSTVLLTPLADYEALLGGDTRETS